MPSRSPVDVTKRSASQPPVVVDRHANRPTGLQLVERARAKVGAQERHRRSIVDAGARKQTADRVAALDALLAPERRVDPPPR